MSFRVVLVGCGRMAAAWVEYAEQRNDVEIVGLVDVVAENARQLKMRYRLTAQIYESLNEAIDALHPDLIFDVASPESRRAIVETALQAGCHVFSEKPMALEFADAKALVNSARRFKKTYAVMQNRRFNAHIRAFADLVQSGAIGIPGWATADFFLGPHFGGFRDAMEHPLLLDMAIHTFDQARLIMGRDPISVFCHEFNPPGSWYQGDAAAVCIFEFEGGQVFTYQGSWCAEGAPTSWEANWRVVGSQGTALWDGSNAPYAEVVDNRDSGFQRSFKRVESSLAWPGQQGHFGCLDAMFDALASETPPETDATDNVKSIAMVFGAIESAARGEKVQLRW